MLTDSLEKNLNNLELFPSEHSVPVPVITYTPSRQPPTSTPSNSPTDPPIPPRACQSLGVRPLPDQTHSSACSELSTIDTVGPEEVFSDSEVHDDSRLPLHLRAPGTRLPAPVLEITDNMETAEKDIKRRMKKLSMKMKSYASNQLTKGSVLWHMTKMDEIRQFYEDLMLSIEELLEDHAVEIQPRAEWWNTQMTSIDRDFQLYVASFSPILDQINCQNSGQAAPAATSNSFQDEQLKLLKQQNEIIAKNSQDASNDSIREHTSKRTTAVKKANAKRDHILDDIAVLSDKVRTVDDWEATSDLTVGKAMRSAASWKKELESITVLYRDFSEAIVQHNMDKLELEISSTEVLFNKLKLDVKECIKSVEKEDEFRELYTLDASKTETIKYPVFGGKDDEDFSKFKEDMEKALVCNRVSRADKISKLRESLRGDALKLIPEALTMDIYDAWKVLEKAYGKPVRLMKVRKKALLEMSYFPRENGAKGVKGQVEWFIEMESLMQNMLNQAKNSMELSYIVYEPELMEKITNKFPLYMALELAKIKGF